MFAKCGIVLLLTWQLHNLIFQNKSIYLQRVANAGLSCRSSEIFRAVALNDHLESFFKVTSFLVYLLALKESRNV